MVVSGLGIGAIVASAIAFVLFAGVVIYLAVHESKKKEGKESKGSKKVKGVRADETDEMELIENEPAHGFARV